MKYCALLIALAGLFFSCHKSDVAPLQLLTNSNMEAGGMQPDNWRYVSSSPDTIVGTWTTAFSSSSSHALEITRITNINPAKLGYWRQDFLGTIPTGKNLTLNVKIKGVNIAGLGAAIAIRTDDQATANGNALQFMTTQGVVPITGTFDWTTYTVKLTGVSPSAEYITVFLFLLNNSTGTVYFDEAYLYAE